MLNQEQRRFLDSQYVIRMATADGEGVPHVVPLCFAVDGGSVYLASPSGTKRARNIAQNPRASLVVDTYDDDWDAIQYLLILGPAEDLPFGEEHARACALLHARYPQFAEAGYEIEKGSVLAVRVERAIAHGDITPR